MRKGGQKWNQVDEMQSEKWTIGDTHVNTTGNHGNESGKEWTDERKWEIERLSY